MHWKLECSEIRMFMWEIAGKIDCQVCMCSLSKSSVPDPHHPSTDNFWICPLEDIRQCLCLYGILIHLNGQCTSLGIHYCPVAAKGKTGGQMSPGAGHRGSPNDRGENFLARQHKSPKLQKRSQSQKSDRVNKAYNNRLWYYTVSQKTSPTFWLYLTWTNIFGFQ